MTDPDLIDLFIPPLEQLRIRYMITGGVAAVIYGEPRFTRDIDLVLTLGGNDAEAFRSAFSREEFYVPPDEALAEEMGRAEGGHFNLIHRTSSLRAGVYMARSDPLHAWGLARRVRVQLERSAIWVAPAEYVIVRKLEYFRRSGSDRHLRDVKMILQVSGHTVDEQDLGRWLDERELRHELARARSYQAD